MTFGRPRYSIQATGPAGQADTAGIEVTPFTIGRDPGSDLVLQDPRGSRRHAQIEIQPDGRVIVRDLDSSNGTFIRDTRIRGGAWLTPPASFRIGQTAIEVRAQFPRPDKDRLRGRSGIGRGSDLSTLIRAASLVAAVAGLIAAAGGLLDLAVGVPTVGAGRGHALDLTVAGLVDLVVGVALVVETRQVAAAVGRRLAPPTAAVLVIAAAVQIVRAVASDAVAGIWLAVAQLIVGALAAILLWTSRASPGHIE
jgi:hypothetical protein